MLAFASRVELDGFLKVPWSVRLRIWKGIRQNRSGRDTMEVKLNIEDRIAEQLQAEEGDISRFALEALAIEGYRREQLSVGEVAGMLGLSVSGSDGFLKEHGISSPLTREEVERQLAALDDLLGKEFCLCFLDSAYFIPS